MKKIALGLAVAFLSTTAFAQTDSTRGAMSSGGSDSGTMMKIPQSGDAIAGAKGNVKSDSRSDAGTTTRMRNGSSGAQETTASSVRASGSLRSEDNVRSRVDSGTRVGVGIETRERSGVAVRRRTVHEFDEPSVEVRRRRTVTAVEEPSTEVHRTVIKQKSPSKKKVVIRKKKPGTHYVVRTRSRSYVEEPSVEVRRRRTVRSYETSEPSVAVSRRTTIRRSNDVGVNAGISLEQRRSKVQSRTSVQSRDLDVSAGRQRQPSSETTGSVSSRSSTSGAMRSGGSSDTGSATQKLPLKPQGSSSSSPSSGASSSSGTDMKSSAPQ
jgi:hypothetical protein